LRPGGKIWRLINSFHPNHLVLLGDIMYTDREHIGRVSEMTPGNMDREYDTLAADKHWQKLLQSVDQWSVVYDDHDYGTNNGDKNFKYREYSQNAFKEFAKDALGESADGREGVYSSKIVHTKPGSDSDFTYKLILVDIRTNKDAKGTKPGDFLGPEQWEWLTQELSDPLPDLVVIGSPIQALADDTLVEEKWGDFPASRDRLFAMLTVVSQRTNVILLSGDVHRAEVSRGSCTLTTPRDTAVLGESMTADFWEFTSSGLSHTLEQLTTDTAASSNGSLSSYDSSSLEVPVKSKSIFLTLANAVYKVRLR
jgi:alkaline phosphatase D